VDSNLERREQSGKAACEVDSEGGAGSDHPETPISCNSVSLAMAAARSRKDEDAGGGPSAGGAPGSRVEGVHAVSWRAWRLGLLVHSRSSRLPMGAYGAGMSLYDQIHRARGRGGLSEETLHRR